MADVTDFAIITIVNDTNYVTYRAGSESDSLLFQSDPVAVITRTPDSIDIETTTSETSIVATEG